MIRWRRSATDNFHHLRFPSRIKLLSAGYHLNDSRQLKLAGTRLWWRLTDDHKYHPTKAGWLYDVRPIRVVALRGIGVDMCDLLELMGSFNMVAPKLYGWHGRWPWAHAAAVHIVPA